MKTPPCVGELSAIGDGVVGSSGLESGGVCSDCETLVNGRNPSGAWAAPVATSRKMSAGVRWKFRERKKILAANRYCARNMTLSHKPKWDPIGGYPHPHCVSAAKVCCVRGLRRIEGV